RSDGEMQYCTDCARNTEPCLGGGTGAMAVRRAGIWECLPGGGSCPLETPTLVPTATPQATATPQVVPNTPTPIPTATPLIDLLYSGKLNLGANASGTPLGLVSISASSTPAPHDRIIYCTSGSSQIFYTMPPATGSGRVIDMIKNDN